MTKTRLQKTLGTIFGSFGKGIPGSISINFSESGGFWCAASCIFKNAGCYAQTLEKRQPSIAKNGKRHRENFALLLRAVANSIGAKASAPWIRFSVFGTIAPPGVWSLDDHNVLAHIAEQLDHTRVHFPVETVEKARALRRLGFHPRVSDGESATALTHGFPVSLGCENLDGIKITSGMSRARRQQITAPARAMAAGFRAAGISAKVCPAIVGNAKCGACRLCNGVDGPQVVIYPRHV